MTIPLVDYPDFQAPLGQAALTVLDATTAALPPFAPLASLNNDMRNFESILLCIDASRGAAATAWNPMLVQVNWAVDAPGTIWLLTETYLFHARPTVASPFRPPGGRLLLMDVVRAPYLNIQVTNFGADNIDTSIRLYGSSRVLARRWVREVNTESPAASTGDDLLVNVSGVALGAGAVATYPLALAPGRNWQRLAATGFIHTFAFVDANGVQFDLQTLAVGAIVYREAVWPSRAVRVVVTNTGVGAGTHSLMVTTDQDTP